MTSERTERVVEVGAGLMDVKNVTDKVYRIYAIAGAGEFVATTFNYKDEARIAEDAAKGGDGTFEIMRFRIPVTQVWPERGAGTDRTLDIDLNRPQQEAISEGRQPSIHVASPLGRIIKQFNTVGLDSPDSPNVAGEVIVVAEYSQDNNLSGRSERRFDIVGHIGDRLNYDLQKGIDLAQAESAGSKRTVKSAY